MFVWKNTFTHFCLCLHSVHTAWYTTCQNFTQAGHVNHTWVLFSPHCDVARLFIDVQHLLTASCSLLVSLGPRHYKTAARLGSHEPPPAQRWPGSTRLSLPLWAGHLGGEEGRKVKRDGGKQEEREKESRSGKWKCDVRYGWWWKYWGVAAEKGEGEMDRREASEENGRAKERGFKERKRLVMKEELEKLYPKRPDIILR